MALRPIAHRHRVYGLGYSYPDMEFNYVGGGTDGD